MTVAAQVKQTIASLKGTKATLDTFQSIESNEDNKKLLDINACRVSEIIDRLENRVKTLEFEEPQYKGL
ncbi:DUF1657 domain-containing protein [Desulforamulus reducens]|uniref:DUF1657 domain-containing protein n=1 Tax=Desulforamulus reducens TaxID=59610 RepID=UPI00059DDA11|nr:DUF1657 domain-containing protein [Desulforamulus reducens]